MINNFSYSENNSSFTKKTDIPNKGRRFQIAAFLLLITAFLISACESPGSVGDDIISDEDAVESQTFIIENYTILEENSFSGRLTNTALGYFDDPLYGTMRSVALLKPAISSADVDTILQNDTVSLQLIFNEQMYGDSLATSSFEIYEAGEIWRGAELRYNNTISVDMSSKVGEFQVEADEDSIVVELNRAWTDKFLEYFNPDTTQSSAERDSIYVTNFRGLAIVPSESNQTIRFLKTIATDEDQVEPITSFIFDPALQDDDDEEGPALINIRDWGASFTRENEPDHPNGIVLHNTERVMKIDLGFPKEEFSSKNIVNAQLIFSKDNSLQKNYPQIARPNTNILRAHVFDEEPDDVMAEIFTTGTNLVTSLNDTSNAFLLNITQHILNEVYGEVENRVVYLTIETVNGIHYSSNFFDPNSAAIKKPRLVITYVEE